jgi:phosphoglycolate phosphatase-like HAD superfamily hydrolase
LRIFNVLAGGPGSLALSFGLNSTMHLVLFDIDGTLTRTEAVDNRCYLCALGEALRTTEINSDWASYAEVTDSGIAAVLWETCYGAPPSSQQLDAVCQRFVALLEQAFAQDADACRAVPGAAAILTELARRVGFAVGLATGGWLQSAQLKLHHAGLSERNYPLASASDSCSREAIMTLAAERVATHWRVPGFQSIVYVGDGVWDVKAARRLGWHFVGIGSGESAERLRREGALRVFADYNDQGGFFDAIAQHG